MPWAPCTFKAVPPAEALTKRLDPGGMGKGGLSVSLEFWSWCLEAFGNWWSLPGAVGYWGEPRDGPHCSGPNMKRWWQTKPDSHWEVRAHENQSVLWVETWTTGNRWYSHFFCLLSAVSPWTSQPSGSPWSFSWPVRSPVHKFHGPTWCIATQSLQTGMMKIQCDVGLKWPS